MSQTYQHLEIICCDDGSTDDSRAILERFAALDRRVRVIAHEQNFGVVATRNRLLEESRGDFIAWLDADDFIAPGKIEKQIAFMTADPRCGAVGTAVSFVDLKGEVIRTESYPDDVGRQRADPYLCCASVMTRREAAEAAGGFRPLFARGGEDGDWLLRIADQWSIRNVASPLYYYRLNSGGLSGTNAAAVRRLGVVARMAARERRTTGVCPIDAGEFIHASSQEILSTPRLSAKEKVLALSFADASENPLVTVAIPFFDAHEFIDECLESLGAQSFQNFEVLIYDDGSQDPLDLDRHASSAAAMRGRIRVLRGEQNRGPAFARNRILDAAAGRYILFQDADDTSEPSRLWLLLEELMSDDRLVAVGSGIVFCDLQGRHLRSESYPRNAITPGGFNGCCASFLYRFESAKELRFDARLRSASEDVDFLLRLEEFGSVRNISATLYRYRLNPKSLTANEEWLDAHGGFMWKAFARRLGVFDESGLSPDRLVELVLSADGTQTAELLMTSAYRRWRKGSIGAARFVAMMRLFPRTSLHILYQHLLLAFESRGKAALAWVRKAKNYAGSAANLLVTSPARSVRSRIDSLAGSARAMKGAILVHVLDNWGDAEEALALLLPGGRNRWGQVQFTTRKPLTRKPDYLLVLNQPSKSVQVKMSPNRVWFAIGEPPTKCHEPMHLGQGDGTVVFTPARRTQQASNGSGRRYRPSHCMTRTWWVKRSFEDLSRSETVEKSRTLSWVTSDLALIRGHRERLGFLKRAKEALEFDLFGRGFNPIEDKWDGLAPYRFSIAYENTRAPGYFTEKLMDCFVTLTVPFYVGAPDIHDYFPPDSVIRIDPEDEDVFSTMRDAMTEDEYMRRLPALREAKHLVLCNYNMFIYLANAMMNDEEPPAAPRRIRLAPVTPDWSLEG